MPAARSFYDVLTAAVADLAEHGYDSKERLDYWLAELGRSAVGTMLPELAMEQMLRQTMAQVYARMIDRGEVLKFHAGIGRFTIDKVRPQLRAELDRRILAAASLIKINRRAAIEKTLQRFSGWATSIPIGGSDIVSRREEKTRIRKSIASLPFEERRVIVDQSHKLVASINEIIARDGAAIALIWHSHWRQPGYNYREDHKERDGKIYALRGTWALEKGLMKAGPVGYYEDITAVGQEPFCRCYAQYLYSLRVLPPSMLTRKGEDVLKSAA